MSSSKSAWSKSVIAVACCVVSLSFSEEASACGCFAPPIPTPEEATFAVNQQAEQIIFEVADGRVSAHVRIFYQGEPEEFAWLLPMPNVPDLELSNGLLFGLIDEQTQPIVSSVSQNICPEQQYVCRTHPPCPVAVGTGTSFPAGSAGAAAGGGAPIFDSADDMATGNTAAPPPVQVLAQERIGSYETITFAAEEANLAIDWLNDNGFIVNETMSPYMQPYLDSGMVFVASRLVPGADVDEIRPLKLTYDADTASIPLQLTAIAAEPHMTVTAFIYSDEEFDPVAEPLTELTADELVSRGRTNYSLVLARAVDDAGGNAFVKEYVGVGPVFQDTTGCCSQGNDWCGAGSDGVCQCPGTDFDASDCAEAEELGEAINTARELSETYSTLTRLTTRVSPEEMVFNPEFSPSRDPIGGFRLSLRGTEYSLAACEAQVVDTEEYETIRDLHDGCADLYCDYGECALTAFGAGCACGEGFAARTFTDVDGTTSLTCVPDRGTVDFAAGGLELPDACEGVQFTDGECVDIGGFAALACGDGMAAVIGPVGGALACVDVELSSEDPGARNFSVAYQELDVCAPPPPSCPATGWLEERQVTRVGVECGDAPDPSWFEIPPEPDCSQPAGVFPIVGAGASSSGQSSATSASQMSGPVVTSEPRPELDEADDRDATDDDVHGDDGGGCAVAGPSSPGGSVGLWSALLAFAALLRRRAAIRARA